MGLFWEAVWGEDGPGTCSLSTIEIPLQPADTVEDGVEPLLFVDDVCAVNSSGLHVKSNSGSLRPNSRVVHGPLALAFARGTITWWRGKVVKPPNQTLVSLIEEGIAVRRDQ